MNKKVWLVPALIFLGTCLIFISIWAPKNQNNRSQSDSEIGRVSEKSGQVTLMNNEMPDAVSLKMNTGLNAKDVIRTNENSEASIQFKNEGQFHLSEKSEVLIDLLENGEPVVLVRSGDLFIERFGKDTSFWIRQDGQLFSAVDFALANKSKLTKLKDPVPSKSETNQISQLDIENLLNSKKNDFFKCYGQVLQKNSQARGSVLISFTILNQGQTSKIEISKSDISETVFKSCLTEVVARTQFKAFTGAPITTVFPLKFE